MVTYQQTLTYPVTDSPCCTTQHHSFHSVTTTRCTRASRQLVITMPLEPLRITLRSSDGHDGLERRISLFPNKPFTIGRASTNSLKPNLMAAADNAFIDSPVISRDHAFLTLRLSPPAVHITDSSSMHGTMVNGVKLKPHRPRKLNDGDVLQFGADVSRNDQYFVARRYTYQAPPFDIVPLESPPQPSTSVSHVFTVPESDSDSEPEYETDSSGPYSEEDGHKADQGHEQKPSPPPRSRLGSQANPVPIEDTEDVAPEVIEIVDNERDPPNTLDQSVPEHVNSWEDGASMRAHGSTCSGEARDARDLSCFDSEYSGDDTGSDVDAKTDFEVSSDDDEDDEDEDEDDDEDAEDDDHEYDDDQEMGEPVNPARLDNPEHSNPAMPVFQAVNEHISPVPTTARTTPPVEKFFTSSVEAQSTQAAPKAPEPPLRPSNSYKTGPFAPPQGNYAFGCVDSSLPYGGKSSMTRPSGFTEYVSPYMPRDVIPFETSAYDLSSGNGYIPHTEQRYPFEPFSAPTFSFAPSLPMCTYPPPLSKSHPLPEPAATNSTAICSSLGVRTPSEVDLPPQPVRRTKVPISEIVEDAPPQQPPNPPSVSGTLKRKAEEMEEEMPAPTPESSNIPSTADGVAKEPSETAPALTPSTQDRPKKRLRAALGSAAKMAAYLIPSTAIAVGMLTQLPDAFFQG